MSQMGRASWIVWIAAGLALAGTSAEAEEWHEAYRAGVTALSRGDAERAAAGLRRAVALRPEPGRNVVTYGTNVEPRYYPYLRLAEAYVALGQLDAARDALRTSAKWGREPDTERQALEARVAAALDPRRPPPTGEPSPSAAPTAATPEPTSVAATSAPAAAPPLRPAAPTRREVAPTPAATAPTTAAAAPTGGTLEVLSNPANARVYLDDEILGSTNPESGRLVKTGLRPGRHHLRVTLPDHEEVVREVDISAGATVALYATLTPRTPEAAPAPTGIRRDIVVFGVVVAALLTALAWMALRRPSPTPPFSREPTPRPGDAASPGPAGTPPGNVNPGARRDELGQEWFGEYRLFEMLGRGGMASVYKAERRGELSALKRPLGSYLDDPAFLERFLREAEIGRSLNHPAIVRIIERGDVDRIPYFTMELLPGQTLQAFVRGWGAAEPRTAALIVAQVAEALDFAHNKGVIHRDLKPSNIMLLLDGTAKVMDFGIARARRFEGLTTTGSFLGTPEYIAPEIVEGHGAEARSDLYSLGALFYELLTGQRPFTGETPFVILKKHCNEDAIPPSRLQPGIPPELDTLVLRLLAKSPDKRPGNAEELVLAIRDWLNRAA